MRAPGHSVDLAPDCIGKVTLNVTLVEPGFTDPHANFGMSVGSPVEFEIDLVVGEFSQEDAAECLVVANEWPVIVLQKTTFRFQDGLTIDVLGSSMNMLFGLHVCCFGETKMQGFV
jgi:hypothetical protein